MWVSEARFVRTILTNFVQKFKVRIEDPPRRRHMVFLGGAVLANIVGRYRQDPFVHPVSTNSKKDGRQGGHVDLQTRMARARAACIRKVREKIEQGCVFSQASVFMDGLLLVGIKLKSRFLAAFMREHAKVILGASSMLPSSTKLR